MFCQIRNRTLLEDIVYALNLHFDGPSLISTSEDLSRFVKKSHTAIRDWIQKYKPERLFFTKSGFSEFIIDEPQIKVGPEFIWLVVDMNSKTNKNIVETSISKERNMFVAERFLSSIVNECGKQPIFTEGVRGILVKPADF
jgi:putative transposase